ncbi:lasso peptide biosynthesis B2 protein [Rhodococcus erythropolis]|uniref:lasso peptide biosynthesis B2 protein n=1 Tax=Rhodococcus erythropolis TaxID=1833 RepID=UPI0035B1BBAA
MTTPIGLEASSTHEISFGRRALVLAATVIVRPAARMNPNRLKRLTEILARTASPPSAERTMLVRSEVVTCSVRCSGQYCLERALAVCLLLRLEGSWPTWCVGARIEPFMAHSWVEVNGIPIGESFDDGFYAKLYEVHSGT